MDCLLLGHRTDGQELITFIADGPVREFKLGNANQNTINNHFTLTRYEILWALAQKRPLPRHSCSLRDVTALGTESGTCLWVFANFHFMKFLLLALFMATG